MGLFRHREETVEAEAELVFMAPTPKGARQTGKLNIEYELTLKIDRRETKHTCVVPHERMPLPGDALPVHVAASDPTRVVKIDFDRMPVLADRARASAAAAQAGDNEGAARALGYELRRDERRGSGS